MLGYRLEFDFEGEYGIVLRAYGTAARVRRERKTDALSTQMSPLTPGASVGSPFNLDTNTGAATSRHHRRHAHGDHGRKGRGAGKDAEAPMAASNGLLRNQYHKVQLLTLDDVPVDMIYSIGGVVSTQVAGATRVKR